MLTDGMFHSRDASNRRDAHDIRDARNVGNNSSRKNINNSSHGNTAETLATAGAPGGQQQ